MANCSFLGRPVNQAAKQRMTIHRFATKIPVGWAVSHSLESLGPINESAVSRQVDVEDFTGSISGNVPRCSVTLFRRRQFLVGSRSVRPPSDRNHKNSQPALRVLS